MKHYFKFIQYMMVLILRVGSGYYIFLQGYEKLTGNFKIEPLIPVVIKNEDSPVWFKWFFEHVVAHTTSLFNLMVPLGEVAIGLGLMFGIMSHLASFFGAFIMINYILSDMIFTYPLQLALFIILLMNKDILNKISLRSIIIYIKEKGEPKYEPDPTRRR